MASAEQETDLISSVKWLSLYYEDEVAVAENKTAGLWMDFAGNVMKLCIPVLLKKHFTTLSLCATLYAVRGFSEVGYRATLAV